MSKPERHSDSRSGFTLVELSILLTILSIIAATAMMDMVTGSSNRAQNVTMQRMSAIQEQLTKYYSVFYRIPCPSRTDVAPGNSQFGAEGGPVGSCAHSSGILQPAIAAPTPKIVLGSVPTRVLNLPDEYMFDGWGRRIDYVVDIRYTTVTSTPLAGETLTTGAFTAINDYAPDVIICTTTTCVVRGTYPVILMSHGVSGNGAVPIQGVTVNPDNRLRTLPSNGNTDERLNIELNGTAMLRGGVFIHNPFLPSNNTTSRFDMIVYPINLGLTPAL